MGHFPEPILALTPQGWEWRRSKSPSPQGKLGAAPSLEEEAESPSSPLSEERAGRAVPPPRGWGATLPLSVHRSLPPQEAREAPCKAFQSVHSSPHPASNGRPRARPLLSSPRALSPPEETAPLNCRSAGAPHGPRMRTRPLRSTTLLPPSNIPPLLLS